MSPEDRGACIVISALLARGRMLHGISLPLTIAGLMAVPVLAAAGQLRSPLYAADASIIVLAGLFEAFLAARVALDADLFAALAAGPLELDGLDGALGRLGLAPGSRMARPFDERGRGAVRLMKQQAACLLAQVAAALAVSCVITVAMLLE